MDVMLVMDKDYIFLRCRKEMVEWHLTKTLVMVRLIKHKELKYGLVARYNACLAELIEVLSRYESGIDLIHTINMSHNPLPVYDMYFGEAAKLMHLLEGVHYLSEEKVGAYNSSPFVSVKVKNTML